MLPGPRPARSVPAVAGYRPMNLLFRIIYAAHANGTHHKLALDALRHLDCENVDRWRAALLQHAEVYLNGSKAPDKVFKDFKNHVLHVRDGYWGGAPEKAEKWYKMLVTALREQNYHDVAWCAGVLSHYYTDPIHPFHTAQSEAENNIHRAVEWSISKSYEECRARGFRFPLPDIQTGADEAWLKDMVIAGAEEANEHYETLIARYDFNVGVVDPPAGLDDACRDLIGQLLVYAASGYARILERAIAEADVEPPQVSLTAATFLATLKIPIRYVTRKMAVADEARLVEDMYDELQQTGRVEFTLGEDERTVRYFYRNEVLTSQEETRSAERARRRVEAPEPQGDQPATAPAEALLPTPSKRTGKETRPSVPIVEPAAPTPEPAAPPEPPAASEPTASPKPAALPGPATVEAAGQQGLSGGAGRGRGCAFDRPEDGRAARACQHQDCRRPPGCRSKGAGRHIGCPPHHAGGHHRLAGSGAPGHGNPRLARHPCPVVRGRRSYAPRSISRAPIRARPWRPC